MLDLGELDAARCRARAARSAGPARRRRPCARRARPAADDPGDVQGDRRALDRLDALAVPDARAGRRSSTRSSTPAEALERLWQDVAHVCRLDEPDPAAAWETASTRSGRRARGSTRSTSTRSTSRGRAPTSRSGCCRARASRRRAARRRRARACAHVPNIPTEEVYTTPDPERTHGVVTATKPLDIAGSLITGLRIRFEGGRAVEIDADTNADTLRQRCAVDDGASRLGEVALVDARAASASSGERSSRRCSTRTRRAISRSATRTRHRSATTPTCRASTRAPCTSTS